MNCPYCNEPLSNHKTAQPIYDMNVIICEKAKGVFFIASERGET